MEEAEDARMRMWVSCLQTAAILGSKSAEEDARQLGGGGGRSGEGCWGQRRRMLRA